MNNKYDKFKKQYKKIKIDNHLKDKILKCLKEKSDIWIKLKKNDEIKKIINRFKNKNLENIFINRLELFINNIVVSYLYWIKWKESKTKKSYNNLINNINEDFKRNFGKSNSNDIKILIYIYNNIFDKIITKDTLNYCLNKLNSIRNKNDSEHKMKGGIFILHYLEENYTWGEWLMIFVDLLLDIVGLIPPVGWAVDIAGVIISILRKDFIGAIMSLIGIIPVVGSFINTPYSVIVNGLSIIRLLKGN